MVVRVRRGTGRARRAFAAGLTLVTGVALLVVEATAAPRRQGPSEYVAEVEVVRGPRAQSHGPDRVQGVVFDDADRDGHHAPTEPGVPGVSVSNGREVVRTDGLGRYELPAYENMTVFVTKPEGYEVPLDEDNVPQFFYHHLPDGSPDLRFGGLPPTGPLPQAVNFPLARTVATGRFDCAIIGDTQTYSNRELGYLRDGVVADLAARDDLGQCGALIVGDVVGDDLGLYPRLKDVMGLARVPIRAVPGNHDLDFDAGTDEHSFDTYRREIGPEYYSYDVGQVHFVGLDNVRYPCTPEVDNADGEHPFCSDPANHPRYNGVIGEEQLTWLANDLAHVPKDRLVVIASHIPLVSFIDMRSTQHQTDDVTRLYSLLEGRPALSVAGHAQTVENMPAGDSFAGWRDAVGVQAVPFHHIVVGAASGSWWTGDLDARGIPEAIQRNGAPPGYLNLAVRGNTYRDTYRATRRAENEQMWSSISSPAFRQWFETMKAWKAQNQGVSPEPPPVNINDLGDPGLVTRADLVEGSHLVTNVWNGATGSRVLVEIDERRPVMATRTQQARGEGLREGAEFGDPLALMRQLQVSRHALASTSGDVRAQGWEAFRGDKFGSAPPQPLPAWLWSDQSPHLWKLPLPADLVPGPHTARVTTVDRHGRRFRETLLFEVAEERPPTFFRTEQFTATTAPATTTSRPPPQL